MPRISDRLASRYVHAEPQERHLTPEGWIGYQLKIARLQAVDYDGRARYRSQPYRRRELLTTILMVWLMTPLVLIMGTGIIVGMMAATLAWWWTMIVMAVLAFGNGDLCKQIRFVVRGGEWPGPMQRRQRHGF